MVITMKLVKISDIFDVKYGVNLALNQCEQQDGGIPFVSRTSENNGVSAYIKPLNIEPNQGHTLSVAGGGSVLSTFYQSEPYYSGRDLYILIPKIKMNKYEMLMYCSFIEANKYKYSYGRQANKTLSDIKIPDLNYTKHKVLDINFKKPTHKPCINKKNNLEIKNWIWFNLIEFFEMKTGQYYSKEKYQIGKTPIITSTQQNNGVSCYLDVKPHFLRGITIGKVSCSTFYQNEPFSCSSDVTTLVNDKILNPYIGIFLTTIINIESFKWSYGRQIRLNDAQKLRIKLPATKDGNPDWQFMEDYIKSLPYSASL